jgi:hypothetical protein
MINLNKYKFLNVNWRISENIKEWLINKKKVKKEK